MITIQLLLSIVLLILIQIDGSIFAVWTCVLFTFLIELFTVIFSELFSWISAMALEVYTLEKLEELEKWLSARAKKTKQVRLAVQKIGLKQIEVNHKERVAEAKKNLAMFFDDAKSRIRRAAPLEIDVDDLID